MTQHGRISSAQLEALMPQIAAGLDEYPHDQFARYPARGERDGRAPWEAYLLTRLRRIAEDPEWTLFGAAGGAPLLLGARTARWDLEHFGLAISSLAPLYCPDRDGRLHERTRALLDACLAELKDGGVRFVSARVDGDQLGVIHVAYVRLTRSRPNPASHRKWVRG